MLSPTIIIIIINYYYYYYYYHYDHHHYYVIFIIDIIIMIIIMRLFFVSSATVKPSSLPYWIMESYDFWVCGWNSLVLVQFMCICNRFCHIFKWFYKVFKI